MKFILRVVVLALACPTVILAEQRVTEGHVVHSRRAPVIAHKVVPPFKGVHVYEGRPVRR